MTTIKKFILCILLLFVSVFGKSQTIKQTIQLADSMVNIEQYHYATKLYLRCLYFIEDTSKSLIYEKLANTFYKQKLYSKAEKYYSYAYINASQKNKNSILLKRTTSQIYQKKFNFALQSLFSLTDSLKPMQRNTKNLYLATCYFGLQDFEKSQKYFLILIPDSSIEKKQAIKNIFNAKGKLYKPNPDKIYIASLIIPGSGQILYGDIKNSLNSFFLTGSLGFLGYFTAINYSLLDASLSIFPWFLRYYQGGATNAQKAAFKKREQNRATLYNELLKIVYPLNLAY